MIDGEELAAFVAVAETRSFVKAGDRLGIAQSAVSKRLRQLEDRIGAELVDRSNRRAIDLTRLGNLYLAEARETLGRLETAERIGRNLGRGETGPLRIGYVFSAAMTGLVTRLARGLVAARPALDLEFSQMETPEQLAALAEGRLDLALTRPRPSYPESALARAVHREGILLAVASSHPLAVRPDVSVRDLAGSTFLVPQFRETVGLIEHVHALARKGGFPRPRTIATPDYITAASLAAGGIGLILAPSSLRHVGIEGLAFVPIRDFGVDLDLVLARRRDMPPSLAALVDDILPALSGKAAALSPIDISRPAPPGG